jgi:DNA-directed RNA polymerase specialized sigma24 family protein
MSQHDLLIQYRKARGDLVKLRNRTADKEDRKHLADMIADCEFITEWLSTGRRPGSRRGIDRRSVYELTKVWDPEWFEDFIPPVAATAEYEITLSDEFNIDGALTSLSERERQCYVLHVGFDYTMMQVAHELQITKASVQTHINRAKQKIEQNINRGLFPSSG